MSAAPNPFHGDESRMVQSWLDDGWEVAARRLHQVSVTLGAARLATMGDELVEAGELVVQLEEQLATRRRELAAEGRRLAGEVALLEQRVRSRHTELGEAMDGEARAAYSQRLARVLAGVALHEEDRTRILGDMRTQLVEAREARDDLALRIRSGRGLESVPVVDLVHHADGVVVSVRLDTGAEVARRDLSDEERQADLYVGRGQGAPAGRIQ